MNATGLRKAAAVLAGLHHRDREWMLARLPLAARVGMQQLLAQLAAFHVTDRTLIREAIDLCEEKERTPASPAPDSLLAGLRGMTPEWKARVLAAFTPDPIGWYVARHAASDVQAVRAELLGLPKQLPPKFADALVEFVRCRGERAAAPAQPVGVC